jgi:spore coat protein U-like protein
MSKFAVKGIIAAVLAVASSVGSAGTDSTTLVVSARIQGGCVLTTSGPMAFGDLNMAGTQAETKTVDVTYKCASGVQVHNFFVGGQSNSPYTDAMTSTSTTATIPYTISWTAPALDSYTAPAAGFSDAGVKVTLTGTIALNDYLSKPAGSYSDSVVLHVNY